MSHKTVLKSLITEHKVKFIAEVGVCRGALCRSNLKNCSSQIAEYWAIDPWRHMGLGHGKSSKYSSERWETLYLRNCQRMLQHKQLRIIRSASLDAVEIFPDGYFDLVYLDASHKYEDVKNDIEAWKVKVRDAGILAGHDYNLKKSAGVRQAIDEVFNKDELSFEEDGVWFVKYLRRSRFIKGA